MNINLSNYDNTGLITLFLYSNEDILDKIDAELVTNYLVMIDNLDIKVALNKIGD